MAKDLQFVQPKQGDRRCQTVVLHFSDGRSASYIGPVVFETDQVPVTVKEVVFYPPRLMPADTYFEFIEPKKEDDDAHR